MSAYSLTNHQQSYAGNRIKGMNQVDALRNSTYKTSGYTEAALRVQAHKLEHHANISLTIVAHREEVAKVVNYDLACALAYAIADREKARELGQIGAANAANRLAADLMGLIIDRHREVPKSEDPVEQMMLGIDGRSRLRMNGETQH